MKGNRCNQALCIVFMSSLLFMQTEGEQIEDVQRVLDDIFKPPKYNKMIRGVNDQMKAVDVNVTFKILSIDNLDEVEETLEIMGVLYARWNDERLIWNPADYNNTITVHVYQNEIWKPEIVLANPASEVVLLGHERIMTAHNFDGTAHWNVGGLFKFYCPLDVTSYPWDRQTCTIRFMVWGYHSTEVTLTIPDNTSDQRDFHGNGAWELLSTHMTTSKNVTIPFVNFSFKLRRYSLFSIVNIFIPILTLTFLNILAYFIPTGSGEKLSYCITVLLALAVFLSIVSEHLPKNSNNMASLCYFLMFVLMMSTIICASSVVSVNLYHKSEGRAPPLWLRRLVYKRLCCRKSRSIREDSDSVKEFQNVKFEGFKDREVSFDDGFTHNSENVTWQDVSKFVNDISLYVTLVWISVTASLFTFFVLSR